MDYKNVAGFHLEVWLEGFLLDQRVQDFSPGMPYFYQKKLALLVRFCEAQVVTDLLQISPDLVRRYRLWLEGTGHNARGIYACSWALRACPVTSRRMPISSSLSIYRCAVR